MKRAVFLLAIGLLTGCASTVPPPGWQQGGAPLWMPRAVWRAGTANIDLLQDGQVFMNGVSSFKIDVAGRVVDADGLPVALLRPDGRLIGNQGEDLGVIGPTTAAAPGARYASFGILPSGQVVRFEDDGQTVGSGAWSGCGGHAASLHACMLVTYLVATRFPPPSPQPVWNTYNGWGAPTSPWMSPYSTPGLGFGISPW